MYDEVVLGESDSKLKRVPIMSGRQPFADALKKEFPGRWWNEGGRGKRWRFLKSRPPGPASDANLFPT